jgi:hypothetical protein
MDRILVLHQRDRDKPLEPFSGSVNYTMANKRRAVTPLTFQASISGAKPTQVDADFICYVL